MIKDQEKVCVAGVKHKKIKSCTPLKSRVLLKEQLKLSSTIN